MYMLHSFRYKGKDDSGLEGVTLGEHVVLRLTEPYRITDRNVTTDYFLLVDIAKI